MSFVGCRDEFVPVIYILAAMSSIIMIRTLGSSATSTRLSGSSFLKYWCWSSCQSYMITLMAMCVHIALALRLKLKLWDNPHWYLQVYGLLLMSCLCGCLRKSVRLRHGRKKVLKTSIIC
jgi:hypothetical protein